MSDDRPTGWTHTLFGSGTHYGVEFSVLGVEFRSQVTYDRKAAEHLLGRIQRLLPKAKLRSCS